MIIHICGFRRPHRLRTPDGGYVFLSWHPYLGPDFYRDWECRREIKEWWKQPGICRALNWFTGRGERA